MVDTSHGRGALALFFSLFLRVVALRISVPHPENVILIKTEVQPDMEKTNHGLGI